MRSLRDALYWPRCIKIIRNSMNSQDKATLKIVSFPSVMAKDHFYDRIRKLDNYLTITRRELSTAQEENEEEELSPSQYRDKEVKRK